METPPIRRPPKPLPPANVALPPYNPPRTYSAPRRFGIGTMLWVATACGVLIWVLQLFDTPPPVIIAISIFLAVVAGMQAVFQESPRWASIITGEVCVIGCFVYLWVVEIREAMAICAVPFMIVFGLIAGYCGGAVVAGFFMTVENAAKYFAQRRKVKEEPVSVWERDD